MEEVKTVEQKKDADLKLLISGILFHTLQMSPDGKAIDGSKTAQVLFEQFKIYASQQTASLREENEKLRKFKEYVHDRLDKMGVPSDPEPENNKAHGCRIEGRLNFIEQLNAPHP